MPEFTQLAVRNKVRVATQFESHVMMTERDFQDFVAALESPSPVNAALTRALLVAREIEIRRDKDKQ